jgi:hypothetical protein
MLQKIELFVRHCHFSEVSHHKERIPGFSRQKCHDNLLETVDRSRVNITFLLDSFHPMKVPHFVTQQTEFPVTEIKEGSETGSFLKLLGHVMSLKLEDDTIVYFLEDDYLHREGWVDVLLEGFTIPVASYVTLYDHPDKYFLPMYDHLQAKLFHTKTCHWRTTPSTTNTYAMRFKTLKEHLQIHKQFSEGRRITADHDKFIELGRLGGQLISPIPGWSTHIDRDASPCIDWEAIFAKTPLESLKLRLKRILGVLKQSRK